MNSLWCPHKNSVARIEWNYCRLRSKTSDMATNSCKTKNRMIFEKWTEIQEIIGPANKWPFLINKLFWLPNIKHFDRLLVASFVYVNRLNPTIFMEWARLVSLCRDETGCKHFEDLLFRLFDERKYKLYAFHVTNNRYEWLDGTLRHYTPAPMR